MKCFDCPYHDIAPYPPAGTPVIKARFDSSLVLYRPKEGLSPAGATPGEDLYLTGARLTATWTDVAGQSHEISVPPGFVTDLTSVPALLRWLVSRAGPWLEAAVLHDYLYVAWQGMAGGTANAADRAFADRIMLAAMKASGVSTLRRYMIYAGVRIGGGPTYREADRFRFGDATDPQLRHLAAVNDLVSRDIRTT